MTFRTWVPLLMISCARIDLKKRPTSKFLLTRVLKNALFFTFFTVAVKARLHDRFQEELQLRVGHIDLVIEVKVGSERTCTHH